MSEFALRLQGVGKMYKIFAHRRDHLADTFGLTTLMPWLKGSYRDFWALRGIDLELRRGHRIGIIGRNGAGKTTMLKLITGNLRPTEGTVEVDGEVHALLDVGGGFHPEFTGRENVRAALTYQGLSAKEITAAESEIAEFTDLGQFFDQPFKTYSLGMQARLTFACATAFTPDVLIVDEVLGAGDAAFYRRSTDRMRQLMHGGATVLLVSHALQQIQRFCDETIWLEHGKIVMRGATTEVVKAYEKFTRDLDERWLLEQHERQASSAGVSAGDDALSTSRSEWSDLAGLRIESVVIEGERGRQQALFDVGGPFRVRFRASAQREGRFPVTPVALIYRPDGLIVTRHVAETQTFELEKGDKIEALLDLGSLQLGNGDYFLSVGMWADVDSQHIEPSSYYHHIDRSYKFQVVGNPPMHDELFVHPATWRVDTHVSPGSQKRLARQRD
jgi:homopolymeric O-antigen transport system ATP-binding protein